MPIIWNTSKELHHKCVCVCDDTLTHNRSLIFRIFSSRVKKNRVDSTKLLSFSARKISFYRLDGASKFIHIWQPHRQLQSKSQALHFAFDAAVFWLHVKCIGREWNKLSESFHMRYIYAVWTVLCQFWKLNAKEICCLYFILPICKIEK